MSEALSHGHSLLSPTVRPKTVFAADGGAPPPFSLSENSDAGSEGRGNSLAHKISRPLRMWQAAVYRMSVSGCVCSHFHPMSLSFFPEWHSFIFFTRYSSWVPISSFSLLSHLVSFFLSFSVTPFLPTFMQCFFKCPLDSVYFHSMYVFVCAV